LPIAHAHSGDGKVSQPQLEVLGYIERRQREPAASFAASVVQRVAGQLDEVEWVVADGGVGAAL
jgi:hypothetical protein